VVEKEEGSELVVEIEEEAEEQEEITGRIIRRMLPTTTSSRLVAKLWVSGREAREAKRMRVNGKGEEEVKEQIDITG
jgi:hypothetical protein